jgi:hypothetical protein
VESIVEIEKFIYVRFRVVVFFHAITSGNPHLLNQVGTVKEKSNGVRKLISISIRIKEAGYPMLNEFTP